MKALGLRRAWDEQGCVRVEQIGGSPLEELTKKILDWIDRTRQQIELDKVTMPRTRESILIDDIETLCKQTMEG